MKSCSFNECKNNSKVKGLCLFHYSNSPRIKEKRNNNYKKLKRKEPLVKFLCYYCHNNFGGFKPNQIYCSRTCKRNALNYRKRNNKFKECPVCRFGHSFRGKCCSKKCLNKYKATIREKRVQQATPKWVNIHELLEIYQHCPKGMEVDHMVPLRGINVSGLHVPWNLQYLTKKDNREKSNKF